MPPLDRDLRAALDRVSVERPFTVHAIRYGTVTMPRSETFHDFHRYGEPDAPVTMDYYTWLLTGEDAVVLVDTGFDAAVGRRRGRTPLCDPVDALAECGVTPAGVTAVVLTHLHYDHIGNAHRFPDAPLVASERELDFWAGPRSNHPPFARVVERSELDHVAMRRASGTVVATRGVHVVQRGIEALEVGGHTPGQLILAVSTVAGPIVLASDAVHLQEELDTDRPFAIVTDLEAFYEALDVLRSVQARGVVVVPGHEPETFAGGERVLVGGTASTSVVRLA